MKNILTALALTLFFVACKSNKVQTDNQDAIQFNIYFIEEYCGGAEPTEEIMESFRTPKPLNDTLYIHKMQDGFREETPVKVNMKKGHGSLLSLPPGIYNAFTQAVYTIDSSSEDMAMQQCRFEQSRMPFFTFKVEEAKAVISDTLNRNCDPCEPPRP